MTNAGRRVLAAGSAVTAEVTARSFVELSRAELEMLQDLFGRVGEPVH